MTEFRLQHHAAEIHSLKSCSFWEYSNAVGRFMVSEEELPAGLVSFAPSQKNPCVWSCVQPHLWWAYGACGRAIARWHQARGVDVGVWSVAFNQIMFLSKSVPGMQPVILYWAIWGSFANFRGAILPVRSQRIVDLDLKVEKLYVVD